MELVKRLKLTLKPSTTQRPTSSRARHIKQILQQQRNTALSFKIQAAQSHPKTIEDEHPEFHG